MSWLIDRFRWQSMVSEDVIIGDIPKNRTIYKTTLSVASFSAIESVLIALISAIDTMMVGGLGPNAISAVGICTQPRFVVLAAVLALNNSLTILVSRKKGANDIVSANKYLKAGILICMTISVSLSGLAAFFASDVLRFAGANSDYLGLATTYFRIIMIGNIFYSISLTISAALRGVGNTKAAMYINLSANCVNLIFNYLLINGLYGFPCLKVKGAAIATMIGNIVSLLLALLYISKRHSFLNFRYLKYKLNEQVFKDIFTLSKSTFVEQIFFRLGFFMYAKSVAGLGTLAFAAHNVLMNVMSLSFSFGDGLSVANTSLVGQSLGANRSDMALIYARISRRLGFCVAIVLSLFVIFNRNVILSLFTNDAQVIALAQIPIMILAVTMLFQIPQVITIGSLRGSGDVKFVAMLMFISVTLIRPVLSYILCYPCGLGLVGAWLSVFLDQMTRNVLSSWRFMQAKWIKIRV